MFRLAFFREKAKELAQTLSLPDEEARREVLAIFSKASNLSKLELLMNPSQFEDQKYVKNFDCLFRRRLTGEPLPLITEEIEFYGLSDEGYEHRGWNRNSRDDGRLEAQKEHQDNQHSHGQT